MEKIKALSPLSGKILSAMVEKVDYWTRMLMSSTDPVELYETDRLIWTSPLIMTDDIPCLAIRLDTGTAVKIWVEGYLEAENPTVFSNLKVSADDELSLYITVEQVVVAEIEKIQGEILERENG